MAAKAKSNRRKAPLDTHPTSPVDVNAPRKTRNQRKAGEVELPAPHSQPRRHAPGKRTVVVNDPFLIQCASGSQAPIAPPAPPAPPAPALSESTARLPPVVIPPPQVSPAPPGTAPLAPVARAHHASPPPDPSRLFDNELSLPPSNQQALRRPISFGSVPSGSSIRPTGHDVPEAQADPSRRLTTTDDSDSSDDEDARLPIPDGVDAFSALARISNSSDVSASPAVKPGPILAAAQEAAFLLHAQHQRTIEELTAKHGKSPEAFYALLGSGSHLTRGRDFNSWAAWQAWYSVHGESKPDHVSVGDWTRHVSKEYVKHIMEGLDGCPDTPANRREVLEPTVQWYHQRFANQVATYRAEGKMKQVLDKVISECLRVSTMAYELYNVHVCGFTVNLDPDNTNRTHSAPFGASPEYEEMLKQNKPVIARDLNLWESHLRIAHASASTSTTIVTTPFFVSLAKVDEPPKDRQRHLFSAYLRADLGRILHSLHTAVQARLQFRQWGQLAISRKLCLINWPADAAVPRGNFTLKDDVPAEAFKLSNEARKAASKTQDYPIRASYDKIEYTMIVACEEFMDLDQDCEDFKTVPLVIDTNGRVLLTAEDALKDADKAKEKAKEKSKHTRKARRKFDANFNVIQEGSDGDNPLTTPPHRPDKGKKRARVEDEPQGAGKQEGEAVQAFSGPAQSSGGFDR
ncbi:hypothetical protein H0H92_002513 [Tricholoma furcatifolium]|nr:hypothetical protein H0H92_002513 [Tricholoma furcatifolium]